MKVIAAILFVCSKEIYSFSYVERVANFVDQNFTEKPKAGKDLVGEFYFLCLDMIATQSFFCVCPFNGY